MRLPDAQKILDRLDCPTLPSVTDVHLEGRLLTVGATLLRAHLPGVGLGEQCTLPDGSPAEVVAIEGDQALLSPYHAPLGLANGMLVTPSGAQARIGVGEALLGRVIDALGQPMDGSAPPQAAQWRSLESPAPDPMQRAPIDTLLPMGVRAIDAALSVGVGQRLGIFSPAGCGKSTLLGMLAAHSQVDVVVLALIGERGREVREFIEQIISPELRARSVVILATSDRPALERIKAADTATVIAEYFRDRGHHVLLLVDSLTRYARAIREIALAAGEPMVSGGYPPSLYARLPRLLERAGPAACGSITAFYTVLVEQKSDPLAEEVRSLLDGHIVLSRRLAEASHYPAIDILASISRVMSQVVTPQHRQAANRLRHLLATWQEIALLVRVGEYRAGQDADADDAMARREAIASLLCQQTDERCPLSATLSALYSAVGQPC
ncbi:FliI/YscN family ATPase [Edwardsiella piscicida]|uniref:FliI/YscN family ATPase n=1 Tax=Edwardsiella piscicida TaxID=1263550 RepID=UPI00370D5205